MTKPKPIPVFTGEAARRIMEIDQNPLTEEEKEELHRILKWFNDYARRVIEKNNSCE